jgi:hypothetical protein
MTPLLTPSEVAAMLRMPVKWVLEHSTRRLPLLPSLKLGKYRRYRLDEIQRWMEQRERAA